ncbi:uncharacterized protein [Apostichopus japonicus]|uniref:uncharacterized protein isoform X2 n=1 Tax=Stichopus japonicus TaxID=307972 RepID=UPI003AB693C6
MHVSSSKHKQIAVLIIGIDIIFGITGVLTDCKSVQNASIGSRWVINCRLPEEWTEVSYYRGNPVVENLSIRSNRDCPSKFYVEHGSDGHITCYFPQSQRIFWYDSTSRNARPIISLEGGRKSGYSDGKYDILNNGGLLIKNTTFNDERTFRVIVIVSDTSTFTVDQKVVIYANTQTTVLSINVCGEDSFCLVKKMSTPLVCRESKTGPHTLLTWTRITSGGTQLAEATRYVSFDGSLYETYISTNVTFNLKDRVIVYICTSTINIPSKPVRQIVVMVKDEDKDFTTSALLPTYYREYDDVKLLCTNDNPLYLVWKRKVKVTNYVTIGFYYKGTSKVSEPGYELGEDGSLLIKGLSYPQEGEYICIYNSGNEEDTQQYHIKSVITPTNPTPSIVGCLGAASDCTFNVTRSGYLTCYVEGVRPIVHPRWDFTGQSSSPSTFSQPQLIVRSVASAFNVYLTTYYTITTGGEWQAANITVSCSVRYEVLGQQQNNVSLTLHLSKEIQSTPRAECGCGMNIQWTCVIPICILVTAVINT